MRDFNQNENFKRHPSHNNRGRNQKPFSSGIPGNFKRNKFPHSNSKPSNTPLPQSRRKGFIELNFEAKKKIHSTVIPTSSHEGIKQDDDLAEEINLIEKWTLEREYLTNLKQSNPNILQRPVKEVNNNTLVNIGIRLPETERPKGFIKFHPADFIVEEISQADELITTDLPIKTDGLSNPSEKDKLWRADLVKMGISTLDAIKQISKELNLPPDYIGFAGLKDDIAITSQRISIRKTRPEKLAQISNKHFFLKNIQPGERHIKKGELNGNRFTILVRTESPIDISTFSKFIEHISKNGFWNFFWLQRFGNRTINHKLGALVLKGNYRQAIHTQLFETSPYSSAYINDLRQKAKNTGGNWKAIKQIFFPLPYTFRYELILLDHLIKFPGDYLNALKLIPELLTLWVYAYSSYVANEKISDLSEESGSQNLIPLLMSDVREDILFYEKQLKRDNVPLDFAKFVRPFANIRMTSRRLPVKVKPIILNYTVFQEGFIIAFDLSKGAYATTFLGHLFTLIDDKAVPDWVNQEIVDSKQALNIGSTSETFSQFGEFTMDRDLWQHY